MRSETSNNTEAVYVETVPVKEVFQGQTIWEGEVEVFDLPDSSEVDRIYAWSYETDQVDQRKRTVTVLHVPPITSPELAVRAAIVREREGKPLKSVADQNCRRAKPKAGSCQCASLMRN
jgi:hypothetical protein